jgi:hypothetical protein
MEIQTNVSPEGTKTSKKRTRTVRPYPVHTLEEASIIASTIQERTSGLPFDRVQLAKALGTTPTSSGFTMKLSSSVKYGLTRGGYNDDRIELTTRGGSATAPQRPGERRRALLEAALNPDLFKRFYQMLDGKRLPDDDFAQTTLQRELGVHPSIAVECLGIIKANGLHVGLLGDVGGALYVSLEGAHMPEEDEVDGSQPIHDTAVAAGPARPPEAADTSPDGPRHAGSIFIGHSGSPDVVDFLKTVLDEFDIPYAVIESSYDDERPVASEASRVMRECSAAILVFARSSWARVSGGREVSSTDIMHYQLGAASVLYGDRVISLVESGVETGGQEPGFNSLEFDRERLGDTSLALLAELHSMGVIEVRARVQAPDHMDTG